MRESGGSLAREGRVSWRTLRAQLAAQRPQDFRVHDGTRVRIRKVVDWWRVYCPGEHDVMTRPKDRRLHAFYGSWHRALEMAHEHIREYHLVEDDDG